MLNDLGFNEIRDIHGLVPMLAKPFAEVNEQRLRVVSYNLKISFYLCCA